MGSLHAGSLWHPMGTYKQLMDTLQAPYGQLTGSLWEPYEQLQVPYWHLTGSLWVAYR